MSKSVKPRDISRLLQKFRQALFSGRVYETNLRFEDYNMAKRTQPNDQNLHMNKKIFFSSIPGGVSHKLSNNYYYNRDGRRTSAPPVIIKTGQALAAPNLQLTANN